MFSVATAREEKKSREGKLFVVVRKPFAFGEAECSLVVFEVRAYINAWFWRSELQIRGRTQTVP